MKIVFVNHMLVHKDGISCNQEPYFCYIFGIPKTVKQVVSFKCNITLLSYKVIVFHFKGNMLTMSV